MKFYRIEGMDYLSRELLILVITNRGIERKGVRELLFVPSFISSLTTEEAIKIAYKQGYLDGATGRPGCDGIRRRSVLQRFNQLFVRG